MIIALMAHASFMPDLSTKNKTPSQISSDRYYANLFKRNFPFVNRWIGFYLFTPMVYYFIYYIFSRIDFVLDSRSVVPFIDAIGIACAIMYLLYTKIFPEYNLRNFEMRRTKPHIGLSLCIFVYSVSMSCGFSIIHFGNYALNAFSEGEEQIVTITASKYYVTRGSRSSTSHYEIHFTPPIGGHNYLDVPPALQRRAQKDDKLKLYLKSGFFGMPYIGSKKILVYKESE